ncbi:MAG: DUF3090 domain-containing protein [Actinomycetales bacterium]
MPARLFDYDPPERFVAGTVGQPGSRTFFLQAKGTLGEQPRRRATDAGTLTSVVLEKQQVQALAERVDELLDEVMRRSGGAQAPALAPTALEDLAPLDTPIEEEFRVGTMSLHWDGDRARVVIECFEVLEQDATEPDDDDEVPSGTGGDRQLLRVSLSASVARAFAKRALALVEAGRPPCPFCSEPLDPDGHICPRANGYRR